MTSKEAKEFWDMVQDRSNIKVWKLARMNAVAICLNADYLSP